MKHIEWRLYEPKDAEAVKQLHGNMETRVGRKLPLPDLMTAPILLTLVGETDGKVTHGFYLEVEAEACAIGPNPLPPAEMKEAIAYADSVLDDYRIRIVRSFVPSAMLKKSGRRTGAFRRIIESMGIVTPRPGKRPAIARLLEKIGFTQENDSMTQFYRWTPPADGSPAENDN